MRKCLSLLLTLSMLMACIPGYAGETEFDVQAFVTRLMDGSDLTEDYARFTPQMRAAVSFDNLNSLWAQMLAIGGAFVQFAGETVSSVGDDGYTTLTQSIEMQNLSLRCTVVLDTDGRIAGLGFAPVAKTTPEASQTTHGHEEEVKIGEEPWVLPGTLTLPEGVNAPVPAVVLVHGSGPNDRDESVGAVKPFRDLADSLAQRGIAVLRYDKRTYVYGPEIAASEEIMNTFTAEEETIQDALAAGRLLAQDGRIDSQRIYIVGHSLGAMLAPRIVSESDGLFAGMALLCGANASLLDIMIRQNEDAIAALPEEQRATYEAMLEEVRQIAADLPKMTAEEAQSISILGQPGYYFWEMAQHPTAAELIQSLALPTLLINGERDFQVTPQEGRETWGKTLNLDADYIDYLWADVNHMMMKPDVEPSIAGTTAEYAVACTLDEDVADAIAAFILKMEE